MRGSALEGELPWRKTPLNAIKLQISSQARDVADTMEK